MGAERLRYARQDVPLWSEAEPDETAALAPLTQVQTSDTDPRSPIALGAAVAEYVQRALDAREAQGLPRYVSDQAVTHEIERILNPPVRSTTRDHIRRGGS